MANEFTSETALYSSEDPNGPHAGNAVISTEPINGFQLCGAGGVIDSALVEKLGIQDRVQPFDRAAALKANDDKNKATYDANAASGAVPGRVADIAPTAAADKVPEAPKAVESDKDEQPPVKKAK